jgi:hypothetical protein
MRWLLTSVLVLLPGTAWADGPAQIRPGVAGRHRRGSAARLVQVKNLREEYVKKCTADDDLTTACWAFRAGLRDAQAGWLIAVWEETRVLGGDLKARWAELDLDTLASVLTTSEGDGFPPKGLSALREAQQIRVDTRRALEGRREILRGAIAELVGELALERERLGNRAACLALLPRGVGVTAMCDLPVEVVASRLLARLWESGGRP